MYKIIGADQKEYGPITQEQLVDWISQGRANLNTLAKAESDAAWKPLSQFPEFAPALAAKSPPVFSPTNPGQFGGGSEESARLAVRGPATGLIVAAILGLINSGLGLLMMASGNAFNLATFGDNPEAARIAQLVGGSVGVVSQFIAVAISLVILFGGVKLRNLQNYPLCLAAAILALLPCSCCALISIPFGIWALVVMHQPGVKPHFH